MFKQKSYRSMTMALFAAFVGLLVALSNTPAAHAASISSFAVKQGTISGFLTPTGLLN